MIDSRNLAEPGDPAATGLDPAGDGQMWWDRRFRASLQRAGLGGFQAVMSGSTGRRLRALKDRENWYLTLPATSDAPRGAYLKRHYVRTWRSRLRAKLGSGPGQTAGRLEAQNARSLSGDGIAVMHLIAYGERLHPDGRLESFVMTEELEHYLELDAFLRRRFRPGACRPGAPRDHDLDRLIRQVAQVVRRFHSAGYNHRDLYCCHIFVKEPAQGRFEVKLIDLQRVQRRRWSRRRWIVKDLAQLSWSAPWEQVQCTQRLAFMRSYFGVGKLQPAHKRLIREVLAKHHVMQRKLGVAP